MLRQVVTAGTLLNPAKLQRFLNAFVGSTYTENVTVDSLIDLAKSFGTLDPQKVTFYTLPTHEDPTDPDALALDSKATAVFDALINDQTLPGETTVTKSSATTQGEYQERASKTTGKTSQDHLGDADADRRPSRRRPGGGQRRRPDRGGRRGPDRSERRRFRHHRRRSDAAGGPAGLPGHHRALRAGEPGGGADRGGRGTRRDPGGAGRPGPAGAAAARHRLHRQGEQGAGRRHGPGVAADQHRSLGSTPRAPRTRARVAARPPRARRRPEPLPTLASTDLSSVNAATAGCA